MSSIFCVSGENLSQESTVIKEWFAESNNWKNGRTNHKAFHMVRKFDPTHRENGESANLSFLSTEPSANTTASEHANHSVKRKENPSIQAVSDDPSATRAKRMVFVPRQTKRVPAMDVAVEPPTSESQFISFHNDRIYICAVSPGSVLNLEGNHTSGSEEGTTRGYAQTHCEAFPSSLLPPGATTAAVTMSERGRHNHTAVKSQLHRAAVLKRISGTVLVSAPGIILLPSAEMVTLKNEPTVTAKAAPTSVPLDISAFSLPTPTLLSSPATEEASELLVACLPLESAEASRVEELPSKDRLRVRKAMPRYTQQENSRIREAFQSARASERPLSRVVRELSQELGRTYWAIFNRIALCRHEADLYDAPAADHYLEDSSQGAPHFELMADAAVLIAPLHCFTEPAQPHQQLRNRL